MGWLKDIVHDVQDFTEPVRKIDPLADRVGDTIQEAVDTGWGKPLGSEKSGADVIGAGPFARDFGGDPNKPEDRAVGRLVGTIAAGYGVGAAVGGGEAATGGAVADDATAVDTFATGAEGSSEGFIGSEGGVAADSSANFGSSGFSTVEGEALPVGQTASGTVGTAADSGFTWKGFFDGVKTAVGIGGTVQTLANQRRLTTAQSNAFRTAGAASPARTITNPGGGGLDFLPSLGIDTRTAEGKAALTGWIIAAAVAVLILLFLSRR